MKRFIAVAAFLLFAGACGEAPAAGMPAADKSSAQPAQPATPRTSVAVSGTGSSVPSVNLIAGKYIVSWTAKGGECFGAAGCVGENFIVDVVGDNSVGLVNEVTSDKIDVGSSGQTILGVQDSGKYLLQIQASHLIWTITFDPA